jgi:chromosome segregation ATPase
MAAREESGGGGLPLIGPVLGASRNIGDALADLRSIAEGMQVLPELLRTLARIEARVESLDEEVKQMRGAVESLNGEVGELDTAISKLEPHLVEMRASLRPLKRVAGRMTRGGRRGDPGQGSEPVSD